jgi:septum formation protein
MTLILASKSQSRQAMLDAAGVAYTSIPAEIDERAIEADLNGSGAGEIAEALSVAKAHAVSTQHTEKLVLGSDSLVVCEGRRFDKPASREEAADHLRYFSGKAMELHSGAALLRKNTCEWSHADCARLFVRDLSEGFIRSYLDAEWPEVGYCVGVFRIEGMGIQLFDRIEGSHFTISGMPMLPLLGALRELGVLEA